MLLVNVSNVTYHLKLHVPNALAPKHYHLDNIDKKDGIRLLVSYHNKKAPTTVKAFSLVPIAIGISADTRVEADS